MPITLQNKFEIPFDFKERVPLLKAIVKGQKFDRFLLDTGAPTSCLSEDVASDMRLTPNSYGKIRVDSFAFGAIDFGPLDMKISKFGENRIDGLLGTQEIKPYCVSLDFDRLILTFDRIDKEKDVPYSPLEIFRGRPVIYVEYAGKLFKFVLDTGSSCNWLFPSGQGKTSGMGEILSASEQTKTAFGSIKVSESIILSDMNIGGIKYKRVVFLRADASSFGGNDMPEDGIIGIGAIVHHGVALINFPSGRFLIKG